MRVCWFTFVDGKPVTSDVEKPGYEYGNLYDFDTDRIIPTALIFAIRYLRQDEPELLLVKRSQKVGAMKGVWSPVAGIISCPEEDWQLDHPNRRTALRELEEEVGIVLPKETANIRRFHTYLAPRKGDQDPNMWGKNLVFAEVPSELATATLRLNWENEEYGWFRLSALMEQVSTGSTEDQAVSRIFAESRAPDLEFNLCSLFAHWASFLK